MAGARVGRASRGSHRVRAEGARQAAHDPGAARRGQSNRGATQVQPEALPRVGGTHRQAE
eukprot:4738712-Prymnesium_polylepis.1